MLSLQFGIWSLKLSPTVLLLAKNLFPKDNEGVQNKVNMLHPRFTLILAASLIASSVADLSAQTNLVDLAWSYHCLGTGKGERSSMAALSKSSLLLK